MEKKKNEALLSVRNLEISYETDAGKVHAVNHVDLELSKGETLGLVGETGAGKTTISLGILGLVPNPPGKILDGEIFLEGQDLLKTSEHDMRKIRGKKISMIFQDPMTSLNPIDTVGEQIAEVILLHEKCSRAEAHRKAIDMMEMVGIPGERFGEYPHQFSGGMKQRIVIAIALACQPELLIADEPTTALDVTIQAQVLEMMDGLKRKLGTSLILITHDLGIVAETCDRVAIIYAGEIVETGTAEHIFDFTLHPYTKGLFGSLPSVAGEAKRLTPIPGMMPNPMELPPGCKFAPRCQYKTARCEQEQPALTEQAPGHWVRCFAVQDGACQPERQKEGPV